MKIAIETSFCYIGRGGVTRYIRELMAAIPRVAPETKLVELACEIPNFSYRQPRRAAITAFREFVWTPWLAPRALRRMEPDLLHMTYSPDIPRPGKMPAVATLHDLSQLRYPGNYRPYTRWRWRSLFSRFHDADAVISVSEFTKREAVELLGIPPQKIHVVPLAPTLWPADQGDAALPAGIPARFFLFVGSLAPNKNLTLLVETYALARQRGIELPPMVVVGIRIQGVTRDLTTPANWIFLERLDDRALALMYQRAVALVYPSIYEGFGLPLLEAMAAGCPAVCSPVASLPEAGGDAACFADLTAESYLETLRRLSADPAYRQERVAASMPPASRGRKPRAGPWKFTPA